MNKDYVYKRRLLKLAEFLDNLLRKRFNYNKWVNSDWKGKPDLSCGTKACALGRSSTIPSFRKLGVRLFQHFDGSGYVGLVNTESLSTDAPYQVSREIFDLDAEEHLYLFAPEYSNEYGISPSKQATPKQVAKHIRDFVKRKYPEKK